MARSFQHTLCTQNKSLLLLSETGNKTGKTGTKLISDLLCQRSDRFPIVIEGKVIRRSFWLARCLELESVSNEVDENLSLVIMSPLKYASLNYICFENRGLANQQTCLI